MTRVFVIAFMQLCLCANVILAQQVVLNGQVTDNNTTKAIVFAHVFLEGTDCASYTQKDGKFKCDLLKEGTYNLCVTCIGYHPIKQQVELKWGTNTYDIALTPSVENLSPIVITGTGTRYRIENVPVQTEIISSKSIEEMSGRNVEEIIASLSSSFDYSSSSMGSYIKINGLGKDYVLVLVNGKRLTGGIGGNVDLSRINSEDIEQIEIVKGASSTLYGSDAISGVINIITKKPKQKITVTNNTRYGAYQDWKQLNTFSYNKGDWSSKTSFSWKQNDGYQLNDMMYNHKWESNKDLPYLIRTYDMPVNKKKSYTLIQTLGYDVNKKLSLNSEFSIYEKTLFFPFLGRMHNLYYNNLGASVGGKYKLKEKDFIDFSMDYGNYKYYNEYPYKYNERYITPDGLVRETYYPGDRFKNSEQKNLVVLGKGVFHINDKNTLSAGLEYLGDFLEAKYRLVQDEAESHTASLFVQDEYELNKKVTLVGGVRVIYHNQFGVIATPKISAMYKTGKFTHRATYANGFKSPTLKELYYYYESQRMGMRRLYLGNDDLKPQQSHYYNISTEYKYKKIRTNLSLYVNRLKNKIDYKIIETKPEHIRQGIEETKFRYNISDAQSTGFDWSINVGLANGFSLAGGYSYVDARNITEDIRLNGISEHSATLKASWIKNWNTYGLNMNLSANYKSDKFYLEEDLERYYAAPYQLWKLTTSHTFKKFKDCNMVFIAGVDNILDYVDDAPYGSHYGTLNPGRSLFVGLNIKFTKGDKK
ncbi:TonB-dependent receptor [Labilibacter marinus]|uniref:TonB-dependent receptor n=1 Tax=Labilibacter marinus TaxID=1477105 RepID=UPI000832C7BE|nr:TonB-dependent receptor [Labilibacter marinus]